MSITQNFIKDIAESSALTDKQKNLLSSGVMSGNWNDLDWSGSGISSSKEAMMIAIKAKPENIGHASLRLRHDKEIILSGVKYSGMDIFKYLDREFPALADKLFCNESFMLHAISLTPESAKWANRLLWCGRSFALKAIAIDSRLIEYVPEYIQRDRNFVSLAVQQNRQILRYLPSVHRMDRQRSTAL